MPYADANGVRLYYEETGKGAPIVWVHEFADDLHGWEGQMQRGPYLPIHPAARTSATMRRDTGTSTPLTSQRRVSRPTGKNSVRLRASAA